MSQYKLKSTIKYPTSLIINGLSNIGLEIADSLLAQGGYVILIDTYNPANIQKLEEKFNSNSLISFLDYSAIPHLEEDIRRLDYVFYLSHQGGASAAEISTQSFLKYSNYLDTALNLAVKFEAKFLLTTSIRAHQMLMSRMDIDINFGLGADTKHTVYTEMEVQRYAESLCLEYASKKELNVRIVRLGEVIGEGMDFTAETQFTKLVLAAVSNRELELPNDGLDTEWFAHILDAAYGVIKAQFSKDTQGEIFSIAFENSVTHLSLAYKIQELEPAARDIQFIDSDTGLPPLRLHKPAPNLSKIGWKPRIDLEKAIAESLSAAKLYLLKAQDRQGGDGEDTGVIGRLKSFLAIADQTPSPAEIEMLNAGPVSRLIAERRMQEQARQASLDKADDRIKARWKDRPRTPWQKVRAWVWRNFLDARTNFGWLRSITPRQFVTYVLFIVIGVWLYFNVLAPMIVFGRNLALTYILVPSFAHSYQVQNFAKLSQDSRSVSKALFENAEIAKRFTGAARLVNAEPFFSNMAQLFQNYSLTTEGIADLAYATTPFGEYLSNYQNNTRFRLSSESYLTTTDAGKDYTPILLELQARRAFADAGVNKLQQGSLALKNQDLGVWPQIVENMLQGYIDQVSSMEKVAGLKELATYGADLLGVGEAKTYLILVQDNSRLRPVGGTLASYVLITLKNGAIADLRLQSADQISFDLSKLPAYALNEINLRSYQVVNSSSVKLLDLDSIANTSLYSEVFADLFSTGLNRNIDGVVIINNEVITNLIAQLGNVQIDNVDITSDNLLAQLGALQSENATVQRRNDVISQVVATLVGRVFENYKQNFPKMLEVFAGSAVTKDLTLPFIQSGYQQSAETYGITGTRATNADTFVTMNFTTDPKNISPARYPAMNLAAKVVVNSDSSLTYTYTAKFPAVSNVDLATMCTVQVTQDIKVTGIDPQKIRIAKSDNQTCVIADITNESELQYSWATFPIESSDDSQYNISLGIAKIPGVETIADFEVELNPALKLNRISPEVALTGNKAAFTQTLVNDLNIGLNIVK